MGLPGMDFPLEKSAFTLNHFAIAAFAAATKQTNGLRPTGAKNQARVIAYDRESL